MFIDTNNFKNLSTKFVELKIGSFLAVVVANGEGKTGHTLDEVHFSYCLKNSFFNQ